MAGRGQGHATPCTIFHKAPANPVAPNAITETNCARSRYGLLSTAVHILAWFRKRQGAELEGISQLTTRVTELEHQLRVLQLEQSEVHDRVHKWMRRATAAEARMEREPTAPQDPPADPAQLTPAQLRHLRPVERRRLLNRLRHSQLTNGAASARALETPAPESNGGA